MWTHKTPPRTTMCDVMAPHTPPLSGGMHAAQAAGEARLAAATAAATTFFCLPLSLQDAILQAVVGPEHPLHTWGAGGAGARRSLRGVCRALAARLASHVTTVHVSSWWLSAAVDAVASTPQRFPALRVLCVCVPLLPAAHAVAAMRCLCTPHAAWARCDVHVTLGLASAEGWVDDAMLTALGASCPRLRSLHVQRSPGGRPLLAVAHPRLACRLLARLDLSGSARLSDAAVDFMAASCPALRCVRLSGCYSLEAPRLFGAQLVDVDLSFCASLTDAAVEALTARNTSLQRLSLVRLRGALVRLCVS